MKLKRIPAALTRLAALACAATSMAQTAQVISAPTRGSAKAVVTLDRRTTGFAVHVLVSTLVLAAACALLHVIARFVMKAPSDWTEVLTRFALIVMIYLGAAVVLSHRTVASVEMKRRRLPAVLRGKLDLFITTMVLSLLSLMLCGGICMAWRMRFRNVEGLNLTMAWAYLAMPVGALFAVIVVLAYLVNPMHNQIDTAL
jgi:TRAP-type C4-dicarboxylate transport system permease small subunit